MAFVDTTYLAGERFDTAPEGGWARALLTDPARTADSKAFSLLLAAPRRERPQPAGLAEPL